MDSIELTDDKGSVLQALGHQKGYLERKKDGDISVFGNITLSKEHLLKTIEAVKEWYSSEGKQISEFLDAYQICGKDTQGTVDFTGYCILVVDVRRSRDSIYKYPIYKRQEENLFAERRTEEKEASEDQELQITWTSSLIDIFHMQIEGSGFIEYPDGSREMLVYYGDYVYDPEHMSKYLIEKDIFAEEDMSSGKIMKWISENPDSLDNMLAINPADIFYIKGKDIPVGVRSIPLTEGVSLAVDTSHIPVGSILLAEIPVTDKQGNVTKEFHLLFAQDTGKSIKGPGIADLYFGVGTENGKKARVFHAEGKLWLLLAKD